MKSNLHDFLRKHFEMLLICYEIITQYLKQRINLLKNVSIFDMYTIWRPPTLSELTLMIFNTGITDLESEAFIAPRENKLEYT